MPRVVVLAALPALGLELLGERFVVEAGGQVAGAAGMVTDPSIPVDADFLDEAGRSLRVVANFGVGYDNIDVEAAHARRVRVTNTPDVLTDATAELAVALMLAAGRLKEFVACYGKFKPVDDKAALIERSAAERLEIEQGERVLAMGR